MCTPPLPVPSAAAFLTAHLTEHLAALATDLVELGIPASTLHRYRQSGLLTSLGHGVVGLASTAEPWQQRIAAARLLYPEAVLSHQTAAQLHGIGFRDPAIHVTTPHGSRSKGGVRVHRSAFLPDDHTRHIGGLPLTSRARTLCDLAATATDDRHYEFLVTDTLVRELTTTQRLLECHAELARAGRTGAGRRRRVFATMFSDRPSMAGSELERRFASVARHAGFQCIEYQFRPPWFDGVRGVVDVAFPAHKLIVELDGRRWHATLDAFENDRARDRLATEHGWRVLRFSWRDVVDHPEQVIASIRAALSIA